MKLKVSPLRLKLHLTQLRRQLRTAIGRFALVIYPADRIDVHSLVFKQVAKRFADTAIVRDLFGYFFAKRPVDRIAFSDGEQYFAEDYVEGAPLGQNYTQPLQVFKGVGKYVSDLLEATDAGYIYAQNYVDNSFYFAEDYIGERRDF